jgi:hypothetical protein
MKDIGDFSARVAPLDAAFTTGRDLEGSRWRSRASGEICRSGALNHHAQAKPSTLFEAIMKNISRNGIPGWPGLCFRRVPEKLDWYYEEKNYEKPRGPLCKRPLIGGASPLRGHAWWCARQLEQEIKSTVDSVPRMANVNVLS